MTRSSSSATLAGLMTALCLLSACDWMQKKDPPGTKSDTQLAEEQAARLRRACASEATYDRLKELAFDEAARIRGDDARMLDALAAAAVVRMEEPVLKSRDAELNVTVCEGRFILELPPGAENAFDGERRLTAQIEYAAQAAVDGSGLVYQMNGAEPIIYRLATIGGLRIAQAQPRAPTAPGLAPVPVVEPPAEPPRPTLSAPSRISPQRGEGAPAPAPREAEPAPARNAARPSFNCRHARTRTERMVCSDARLAGRDRRMASVYYARMAGADVETRLRLRRSRDAFLARRERCDSEACVAEEYERREEEIRRITSRD